MGGRWPPPSRADYLIASCIILLCLAKQPALAPSLQLMNLDLSTKCSYKPVCKVKKLGSIDIPGCLSRLQQWCSRGFTKVGVTKFSCTIIYYWIHYHLICLICNFRIPLHLIGDLQRFSQFGQKVVTCTLKQCMECSEIDQIILTYMYTIHHSKATGVISVC